MRVPAAVILNEVCEMDHVLRGITAGFNTVMLSTCEMPYEQNTTLTRQVVEQHSSLSQPGESWPMKQSPWPELQTSTPS